MTKVHTTVICLLFLLCTSLNAQDYSALDKLLTKYVSPSGSVDYAGLKGSKVELNNIYTSLTGVNPSSLATKDAQMAFWINLYNVATLKLIVDNFPLKSITDLDKGKPWDVKRISVAGKSYSLNDIENTKIRTFKDPRIHFAVNCAAKSCPPLLNSAFSPDKLNAQLESQTKKFINNPKSGSLSSGKLVISKIFDWYKEDFGDVIAFINKYSSTKVGSDAKISYQEYDWSLNSK
ncbi:MAG: DUF547 domain-containing protein [Saprospiraceae bacterium]|nr:DUF547 domain-containing protein [Saprospiraceae bacterium]